MKAQMILKPLAFAVAVALSSTAMASNWGHNPDGAHANVKDSQENTYNSVDNEATKNNAGIDGSLGGASGNVGVNVASGDNNQQANAAAIATADSQFVFGSAGLQASASVEVTQTASDNYVSNEGTQNNAGLSNSADWANGNLGINVAAGNSNQQKNDLAMASSAKAYTAEANVEVSQESTDNVTDNKVGDVYEVASMGALTSGFGYGGGYGGGYGNNKPQTPVVNNAGLSNSLNNVSGNVGVNIAAGTGNQQSNSLAIAAGCNACP